MTRARLTIFWTWSLVAASACAAARADCPSDIPDRTANMPDSWLVLYNLNSSESIAWAAWYQQQRAIPAENMLGLNASLNEHLPDLATAQAQIITPTRNYLLANPLLGQKVMGILLGYQLPGRYASAPVGSGGFSIADALEDMTDDTLPPSQQKGNNFDNPQFAGNMLPPGGRLTRATMACNRYMTARIDAPTLDVAMAMTLRALALEQPMASLYGRWVNYDYLDPAVPPIGEWAWLRFAVEEPLLADLPWSAFNDDTDQTPNAAFRLGTHDLVGWNDGRLYDNQPGPKVLAYNYNSYGATTVRSTTAEGGRYVPNAIVAGWAAAIGATGEPTCCLGPVPETILGALREGWTLGEAFYLADVNNDWMWTLVGDPLLKLPNWFNEPLDGTLGNGDINGDGHVNGLDVGLFVEVFLDRLSDPNAVAAADLDGNGMINVDDAFLLLGPTVFGTYDQEVLRGSGDVNGDNALDALDIQIFVDIALNPHGNYTLQSRYAADMTRDGTVDHDDVPLFVEQILMGTPGAQRPAGYDYPGNEISVRIITPP